MITVTTPTEDLKDSLIHMLKKYFEAEYVITGWNGQDEIEDKKTTLLITSKTPPAQPGNIIIDIKGALRLFAM